MSMRLQPKVSPQLKKLVEEAEEARAWLYWEQDQGSDPRELTKISRQYTRRHNKLLRAIANLEVHDGNR